MNNRRNICGRLIIVFIVSVLCCCTTTLPEKNDFNRTTYDDLIQLTEAGNREAQSELGRRYLKGIKEVEDKLLSEEWASKNTTNILDISFFQS